MFIDDREGRGSLFYILYFNFNCNIQIVHVVLHSQKKLSEDQQYHKHRTVHVLFNTIIF